MRVRIHDGQVLKRVPIHKGELLFRPGFYTTLSRTVALNVEGKLGLLRSDFIFLPQANIVFAL